MTLGPIRRHGGLVDDIVGGFWTFVIEAGVVALLGLLGYGVAVLARALI